MAFLKRRRLRKNAREVLRQAVHFRNLRGDVMQASEIERLTAAQEALREALRRDDPERISAKMDDLYRYTCDLSPRRLWPGFRENLEIAVVAVSVAMAFRTYFIQPFKIPTGSMQPTLYGITSVDRPEPLLTDRLPLKLLKWAVTGEWYRKVRVRVGGTLSDARDAGPYYPADHYYFVSGRRYRIPRKAVLNYQPGDYVARGAVLWAGSRTAGDHVFVDRVRWNLLNPRRGNVIVFATRGIRDLPQSTHYIKRLVGMPRETVSIDPPYLLADGVPVTEPEGIRRISECRPGYSGYRLVDPRTLQVSRALLVTRRDSVTLDDRDYLALGDNTTNSKDGRYWGPVPQSNLVGPAFLVYWPFSRRWGLIR